MIDILLIGVCIALFIALLGLLLTIFKPKYENFGHGAAFYSLVFIIIGLILSTIATILHH